MPKRIALTVNIDEHGSEEFMRAAVQRVLDENFPKLFPGVSLYQTQVQATATALLPLGDWRAKRRGNNWVAEEYYKHPIHGQKPESD